MSTTTTVPVNQEACCSLLGKAYGEIIRQGGTLSREINIAERVNFGYPNFPSSEDPDTPDAAVVADYNGRLGAIQYFQLTLLRLAAGALQCDGINSKCCAGFAEGLQNAILGLLEQTIHNAYQTSVPLGTPAPGLGQPIPEQQGTVWANIAVALFAGQTIIEDHILITGSSCGGDEQ